jgi:hypothetical protein
MEDHLQHQSWWNRNWKWAVPTGGCLFIVLIFAGVIGYGIYKVSDALGEDSSLFEFGNVINIVQQDPDVETVIGKPFNIEVDNYDPTKSNGVLDISLEINGSNNSGTVHATARKVGDDWVYSLFKVTVDGSNEEIDLLGKVQN